jgi:hypothetical protein
MKKIGLLACLAALTLTGFSQTTQNNELNSTGKVGVGTTTPTCELDVYGDVLLKGETTIDGETILKENVEIEKTLTIQQNLEVIGISTFGNEVITEDQVTFKQMEDLTKTEDRFVLVDKNGVLKSSDLVDVIYDFEDCHETDIFGGVMLVIPNWAYGPGKIFTGVDCPANVGIRINDPTAALDVNGTTRLRDNVGIGMASSTNSMLSISNDAALSLDVEGAVDIDGSVGIGVGSSSGVKLHVVSNMQTGFCVESNSASDYSFGLKVISDNDVVKSFSIIDSRIGTDIFTVWGNGVVNTKKMYSEEIEVRIDALGISWPDYVFNNDYDLPELKEVESFYLKYNHLNGIPSSDEVNENGINVAKMDAALLKKIEELTLYIVQLEKRISKLED